MKETQANTFELLLSLMETILFLICDTNIIIHHVYANLGKKMWLRLSIMYTTIIWCNQHHLCSEQHSGQLMFEFTVHDIPTVRTTKSVV